MPTEYSVYETKAKLSEILRLVKADREVTITERGKPIAKIVPYIAGEEPTLDERLEALRRDGQIQTARLSPSQLSGQKLSGQKLSGQKLSGQKLSGQKLSGQKLSGQKLSGQKVVGALQRFLEDRS
jgi:prevent-host-death family protein